MDDARGGYAGKQILRPSRESRDLVRKDRAANEHMIVFDEQTIQRDRHLFVQTALAELRDVVRRNRPERRERGGIVPSMIEDSALTREAIRDRPPDQAAQLRVAHRRVRAERDQIIE